MRPVTSPCVTALRDSPSWTERHAQTLMNALSTPTYAGEEVLASILKEATPAHVPLDLPWTLQVHVARTCVVRFATQNTNTASVQRLWMDCMAAVFAAVHPWEKVGEETNVKPALDQDQLLSLSFAPKEKVSWSVLISTSAQNSLEFAKTEDARTLLEAIAVDVTRDMNSMKTG